MMADSQTPVSPRPAHRLDPLLAPRSIAFVGASPRKHTPGNDMLTMIARSGFTGTVFAVNPNYTGIEGRPLSVIRCPSGIAGECFFQKHLKPGLKHVGSVSLKEESGSTGVYVTVAPAAAANSRMPFTELWLSNVSR